MVHLEQSLIAEEIDLISCFCESLELQKNLETLLHPSTDCSKDWEDLLKELADYHHHMEEELVQRQWEEMQWVGLTLGGVPLKEGGLFSREEIRQNLVSLGASLKKADSLFGVDAANHGNQALGAKSSRSVTQKIQATAIKMVRQEAVKQLWGHRVLDRYSRLFQVPCSSASSFALMPPSSF
ncbi:uncharacterized protein LOC140701879 [Pogona vitticeps]